MGRLKNINNTPQKKAEMMDALRANFGIVSSAAKKVGIDRSLHYTWMKTDQEYRAAFDDITETLLDFAESQLFQQIKNGSIPAILFTLKTKGKHRGWIEKYEKQEEKFDDSIFAKIENMQKAG